MSVIKLPCRKTESGEMVRFYGVTGNQYCGETFFAPDTRIRAVTIWLFEGNDSSVKIDVMEGGIQGRSIGTGVILPGEAGARRLEFISPIYLEKGKEYLIRAMSGGPGLLHGAVAMADAEGYEGYGIMGGVRVEGHMAMELEFDTFIGSPPVRPVPRETEPEYREAVTAALREKRDVWGEELIASGGVTYDKIKDKLKPLMHVGTFLTETGVYYISFGIPEKDTGIEDAVLFVADGSQIVSRRASGSKLSFQICSDAAEFYGADLERLAEPRYEDEWKPVLINSYTLTDGSVLEKEMFAAKLGNCDELVSFVKITYSGAAPVAMRLLHTDTPRSSYQDGRVYIIASCPMIEEETYAEILIPADGTPVYLARFNAPVPREVLPCADAVRYETEKAALIAYWEKRLDNGTVISVPEERVMKIQRTLLMQNIMMGWRYSIGNLYEQFFQPESNDAADILTLYGFKKEGRANIEALIYSEKGSPSSYQNWGWGEKISHAVRYYDLTGDPYLMEKHLPVYKEYLRNYAKQISQSSDGLLRPEAFSADIGEPQVYTHWNLVAWQGMFYMAKLLEKLGDPDAAEISGLAARYTAALERAVKESAVQVSDGVWFLPEKLLSGEKTWFDPITSTVIGSYWNLCIYYALASGFFETDDPLLRGVYEYIKQYGAWFLGLLRFNYYPVEPGCEYDGGLPGYKTPGADNVYGINLAEFTAQMDDPERLILMFYGKMAHGMTRGTYVSGEGDTIGAAAGEYYRTMYLPPSSANNSVFLKILRNLLICETMSRKEENRELRLLFSTPREWLASGKTIDIRNAPTLFGPVSCKAVSDLAHGIVQADVRLDVRTAPKTIRLRLRVPENKKLVSAAVNGEDWKQFDSDTATIELGTLYKAEIVARFE